jgi:hypothetical protein
MAGPVGLLHFRISRGTLIGVPDQDPNGAPKGESINDTGEDLGFVILFPRCGDFALAGTSPVQLSLDVLNVQGYARRATIDDHTDASPVGFTPCADPIENSQTARHCAPTMAQNSVRCNQRSKLADIRELLFRGLKSARF